jgi:hypothetical protein
MPFYKWKCDDCGKVMEVLHRWSVNPEDKKGDLIPSPKEEDIFCGHEDGFDPESVDDEFVGCGSKNVYKMLAQGFSISGLDGHRIGGFYSDNLGCWVKSVREEDKIAESRGLRRVSDISRDDLDRAFDRQVAEAEAHERDAARYKAGEKLEDIYSVDRLKKDGLLDQSIKGDE